MCSLFSKSGWLILKIISLTESNEVYFYHFQLPSHLCWNMLKNCSSKFQEGAERSRSSLEDSLASSLVLTTRKSCRFTREKLQSLFGLLQSCPNQMNPRHPFWWPRSTSSSQRWRRQTLFHCKWFKILNNCSPPLTLWSNQCHWPPSSSSVMLNFLKNFLSRANLICHCSCWRTTGESASSVETCSSAPKIISFYVTIVTLRFQDYSCNRICCSKSNAARARPIEAKKED